ncbi:MAG: YifB family Mg chelatase-like AAA ATPase [Candidatus Gracilibacteria bacterium]|nr:YifB family Mg chelatase-like AAA ATPase [Candidatus Gracilibacteria bacterium]
MTAKIYSCSFTGLECNIVEVQADISQGLSSFSIVGMGDISVQESKERIRSSIKNSGLFYPHNKKTINLAPARIKKQGTLFDLPIAISLLLASEQVFGKIFEKSIMVGELSLNGQVRAVDGILPIVQYAKSCGFEKIFLPKGNALEGSLIEGIDIYPVENLKELVMFGKGEIELQKFPHHKISAKYGNKNEEGSYLFSQIVGHEKAKRALMVAASGRHNVLFRSSPGCGKTVLSRAFRDLLIKMNEEEIIETTKIYSVAGLLNRENPMIINRPFREVHHTASLPSIVGGGGMIPKPGEISLAHNGVLFLDEITEFPNQTLESLRQPLEDKYIHINRANFSVKFPCNFILIATMNPCKCGYKNDRKMKCVCTESQIKNYNKKLSGPILDRFDIFLDIEKVAANKFFNEEFNDDKGIKDLVGRVQGAKFLQSRRFREHRGIRANSDMNLSAIREFCALDSDSEKILSQAVETMNLSNRGYLRTLKIARTIADLEESESIKLPHLTEALQYRRQE